MWRQELAGMRRGGKTRSYRENEWQEWGAAGKHTAGQGRGQPAEALKARPPFTGLHGQGPRVLLPAAVY